PTKSILSEFAGGEIYFHRWTTDKLESYLNRFYNSCDDDFCKFLPQIKEPVANELARIILAGVHPEEPAGPLEEASDSVEAIQSFLFYCGAYQIRNARLQFTPNQVAIEVCKTDGSQEPLPMGDPEAFLN